MAHYRAYDESVLLLIYCGCDKGVLSEDSG